MKYVRDMKVWTKIPRKMAQSRGWKIIKTRWIDINKGDDENPVYRSRLVGKEFNNEAMDGIFAGTPPLEALRYVVHEAAIIRKRQNTHTKITKINDVSRALLQDSNCQHSHFLSRQRSQDVSPIYGRPVLG